MMKRVLILASVASMIDQFNMPNIQLLQKLGYAVDVACNYKKGSTCSDGRIKELKNKLKDMGVRCFQIDFSRDSADITSNMKAFWQTERLMTEYKYAFVHCHSPIGGVAGRIAGIITGTKVIYTAHGFHFFKGAPIKNWLAYYPAEKICSCMTDVLITINREDYALARKRMKAKKVAYMPGVGVDISKFGRCKNCKNPVQKSRILQEFGCAASDLVMLSVGELSERKNHEIVIKALSEMKTECRNIKYLIIGKGPLAGYLQAVIDKKGLAGQVKLLGFRDDIDKLLMAADIFMFPSLQEGLPVALMEAMSSGLTCIASRIRGNTDLIGDDRLLFNPKDADELKKILKSIHHFDSYVIGQQNAKKMKNFDIVTVEKRLSQIYEQIK